MTWYYVMTAVRLATSLGLESRTLIGWISSDRWRHHRMSSDRTSAKWHSWTWLQTWRTCFFRAPQYVRPINCVLSTPLLLKEMLRNEGSRFFFYTVSCPRGACREPRSNIEIQQTNGITPRSVLLRCDWSSDTRSDWLNLEPLAPAALARAQSVEFSRTRRMTAQDTFVQIYLLLLLFIFLYLI